MGFTDTLLANMAQDGLLESHKRMASLLSKSALITYTFSQKSSVGNKRSKTKVSQF
jgi:hypothetical protein